MNLNNLAQKTCWEAGSNGGRKSVQLGVTSPNNAPVRDLVLLSNFSS